MSATLESLVHRYLDGTITADEMRRLNSLLQANREARREFAEWLNLDSALAMAAADWFPTEMKAAPVRAGEEESRRLVWLRWLAAAACVALCITGVWWWQAAQRTLATVTKSVGAGELAQGAAMRRETRVIGSGAVELVTARGVRLVIEAPAEFRLESAQRLRVLRGRLSADVPPTAKGFTVVTPSGDAVDLGTRFGVDVSASGAAEVHVFQGEVIAKASGSPTEQSLRGGDAVAMKSGMSTVRELRTAAFIQSGEMGELGAALTAGQRARAEAVQAKLRADPALIALLDFESGESQASAFRTVQGRWPGSRASEFVNVGDHLKLDVGGDREWPQLTLAAWVRLDQLGAPYQSLLHTDGWDNQRPGQVHWMVTKLTTMRLALRGNTLAPGSDEQEMFPDSKTSVLPDQGRWVHLATVYDSEAKTVRFYLNGRFDKETRQAIAHPARLGPARIGNWDRQDRKLSGRVDELLLLGRAMGDAEVRAVFEAGNPYR